MKTVKLSFKSLSGLLIVPAILLILNGCSSHAETTGDQVKDSTSPGPSSQVGLVIATPPPVSDDALLTSSNKGVFYEIFVRSFYDSDGDGVGDLKGITKKLDYLNDGDAKTTSDLGVTGIWLMPIFKSTSYHGYDISDYYEVNPQYGTKADLVELVNQAHKRGIKIILDVAFNHTSYKHPWFVDALMNDKSTYHNWYVWAEDHGYSPGSRSPFGGPAFYGRDKKHYMAIFSNNMPDLNFDEPEVRKEIINVGQYWLKLGIDGFRLDAAKHLYENFPTDRIDPKTTANNQKFWQEFRAGLNAVKPDAFVVGEIWDSPIIVAPQLNQALTSGFNFELAKQLLSSASSERASALQSTIGNVFKLYRQQSQGEAVDSVFLTNHDIDRTASQMFGDLNHARMAASLLLTIPGTPFIYYGEEIGMQGRKPDEYIREPFLWYKDGSDGEGKTHWEPSRDNSDQPVSVEAETADPNSLLSHYRNLIHLRMSEPALQSGQLFDYSIENTNVMGYIRKTENDQILVIHNLTAKPQEIPLNDQDFNTIVAQTGTISKMKDNIVTIEPYNTVFLKK